MKKICFAFMLFIAAGNTFAKLHPLTDKELEKKADMQAEVDKAAKVSLVALISVWQGRDYNWRPQAEEVLRAMIKQAHTCTLIETFSVSHGKPRMWIANELQYRPLSIKQYIGLAEQPYADDDEKSAHVWMVNCFRSRAIRDNQLIDYRWLKSSDADIRCQAARVIETKLTNPPMRNFFFLLRVYP